MPEGHEVVYIAKIGGHRPRTLAPVVGCRYTARPSARPPLLAHSDPALRREIPSAPLERRTPHTIIAPGLLRRQLTQVAETGVAFEHEESAPGINCVAAPGSGAGEELLDAISITGPASRFRPEAHVPATRAATAALTATLTRARRQRGGR